MTNEFALTPPDARAPDIEEVDLLTVWNCYPKKVKRRKALTEIQHAIERLVAGEIGSKMSKAQAVQELVKAAKLFANSPAGNRGQFTPYPTTWFHQSQYLDNPDEWFHQTEDERIRALNQVGVYHP
jgi:hypothetical protein